MHWIMITRLFTFNKFWLLTFTSIIFFSNLGITQWVQTNGPYEASISCFASCDSFIFAGTIGAGIYRSNDNGLSWLPSNGNMKSSFTKCIAVNGKNIFAGSATGEGISLSTDYGSTWSSVNNGLPNGVVDAMAVWDNNIFANITYGTSAMYRSTDNGSSWSNISGMNFGMLVFTSIPNESDSSIGFVGTRTGVYKSTNNGIGWSTAGLIDSNITSLAFIGTNLFASTNSHVYLSTNFGLNWTPAYSGLTSKAIKYLTVCKTDIFAGTLDNGIFLSTNNGAEWVSANTGLHMLEALNCLTYIDTTLYSGFIAAGIYRSTDYGATWNVSNTGLREASTYALALMGNTLFCGTTFNLYSSSDLGQNWSPDHFYGLSLYFITVFNNNIFVNVGNGVYFSSNGGSSWTMPSNAGVSDLNVLCITAGSDGAGGINLYAGTKGVAPTTFFPQGGIFRSTDYGASWKLVGLKDTVITAINYIGTNIYAATNHGEVYVSRDNGSNWDAILNVPYYIFAFASRGNELYIGTNGGGVLRSTNGGKKWVYLNTGLSDSAQIVVTFVVHSENIFIGTKVGVYILDNINTSWRSVNAGLNGISNNIVYTLAASDSYLYAGLFGGVWRRPLSEIITDTLPTNVIPSNYYLSQNYPNPFNLLTTIDYSLPERCNVTLKIYDVLGKEVRILVDKNEDAREYSVDFNAFGLSSGVYLYRIIAGKFADTKKFVLIK
jgi:photosystem II stability/assembly factor-like uncharacterized protein